MKSKCNLKESLNEKAHFSFLYVILIAAIVLVIAAGCFVWFAPTEITDTIIGKKETKEYVFPEFTDISDPEAESERLAALDPTHVEWTKIREDETMNGIYFIPEDGASIAVYNADMNNLADEGFSYMHFDHMWIDSSSTEFYIVVNIPGETVDLSNYYILVRNDSDAYASLVIFNCYEATNVILNSTILTGTLLAPKACVQCSDTYLYGQIYSKSNTGKIKYYVDIPFTGYDTVIENLEVVPIKTRAVKQAVCDALKKVKPITYYDYTYESDFVMADLKLITSLDLDDLAIITLGDDLQYFKHVSSLNFRNSFLKSVDLTGFDSLVSLDISYSSIDFTNISSLPNLKSLAISGKNFSDYDLSSVPGLVYLECCDCNLTDDDYAIIKNLKNLKSLIIANNDGISNIDLSSFTALEQIDVSYCNVASLSLDSFKNSLTYLKCSFCGLDTLDISDFTVIKTVEAYGFSSIDVTNVNMDILTSFLYDDTADIIGLVSQEDETQEETSQEAD